MSVFTNPATGAAEHAAAYTRAILGLVGDGEPNHILRETLSALPRAVGGLSPSEIRRPEAPGKWSVAQILQHLADSEVVWAWRLRVILAQNRPPITGYDQDLWATRLRYEESEPAESLEQFTVMRRANLRVIERASPEDLERIGVHSERGDETLAHLRRLYAGHDLMHLRQIERVKSAVS